MTRSQRFSSVLRLAETRKRNAARMSVNATQKLREYEKKLDELRRFRNEYTLGAHAGSRSMTSNQLQERQLFLRQLDEGISIMINKVNGQKQSSAMEKQVWMDALKHADAMDKLLCKIRKIEIDLAETREDSEVDDRAQYCRINN